MTSTSPSAELGEVTAEHALNVANLHAWMSANIEGFKGPIDIKKFAGGQSNPTFLVLTPAKRYVLRRKPAGKLLPSAHAVDREFRVLQALHGSAVPVARVYALCEDDAVIGSAFYVMDYIEGRIFWSATLPEVAASERTPIYDEMVRVLAALHSVDYRALGLDSYGKSGQYVGRQVSRWAQQYRASATEKIDAMDRLIDWLPQHIPGYDESGIVHGDFRLDNVIFHATEPRILAVLDWELSTIGHPLVDFAYYCMRYHLPDAGFRGLGDVDTAALCIPSESEAVLTYCALRGIEPVSKQDWTYYMAFCMFRLAGILQGVLARALQGNASSTTALEAGSRTRPLAELGWRLVQNSFDV